MSEDRLTWRITLREGVTFHDGTPLTAEDVVYTYEQAANPENGAVWAASLNFMESIEAEGDHEVVIRLSEPYTYFDGILAVVPIISSEREYAPNETYATTENGSGPFKLESLNRGTSIELVRYDDYFGAPSPYERISLKLVPETASRVAMLTDGTADIVPDLPPEQAKLVEERGAAVSDARALGSRMFLYPSMHPDRPTSDADFRLALAAAIDRQVIVDQVYAGGGEPNSTYVTTGSAFADEELADHFGDRADLETAKRHLENSGVTLDRPLELIVWNRSDLVKAAPILQQNFEALGFDVKVEVQEVAGFYPALVSGEYDLILFTSSMGISSGFNPDGVYGGLYSTAPNNFNKFANSEMDVLLDAAMVAPKGPEAMDAWRAVSELDVQTQGQIQILVSASLEAYNPELEGYEPAALPWLTGLLPSSERE